jgi:glycogen debranching enzyme
MKKEDKTLEAYQKAIETVKICSTKYGLFASGGKNGYKGVWARDTVITFLGASLIGDKKFKETFKRSLSILGDNQSKLGEIPNAVLEFQKNHPQVDYKSIDSTLWFIIGHHLYKKRYNESSLFRKYKKVIDKALVWLSYQDFGNEVLLDQLPTTDWQDAFPSRYGKTINTQALYYAALLLSQDHNKAAELKSIVNHNKDHGLWDKDYYYSYRWKNHGKYKELGDWFDSLGNLLAIIFDLTEKKQAKKILNYIKQNKINRPYPMKTIYPPIRKGSKYWQNYYMDCEAGRPNHYLNGGIWPFIGGFYILALIKLRKIKEARQELKNLAEANLKDNTFPEWINPIDKTTHGVFQAWSAGTYILAYKSIEKKKVLI